MADQYALLLLPDPPQQLNLSDFKLALYPTLDSTLSNLVDSHTSTSAVLEIAIPITRLANTFSTRATLSGAVQKLLVNCYTLLATIYDLRRLPSIGTGMVDTNIILVYNENEVVKELAEGIFPRCVVSFEKLALSRRLWTNLFVVESEPGEEVYKRFKQITSSGISARFEPDWNVRRVPGGIQIFIPRLEVNVGKVTYDLPDGHLSHEVLLAVGSNLLFTDKYILTMGFFLVEEPIKTSDVQSTTRSATIYIGVSNSNTQETMDGEIGPREKVVRFLLCLLDFGQPKAEVETRLPEKKDNSQHPFYTVRKGAQIECIICTDNSLQDIGLSTYSTFITPSIEASQVVLMNKERRKQGRQNLHVIDLGSISAVDLDEELAK